MPDITAGRNAFRLRNPIQIAHQLDLAGITYHGDAVEFDNDIWNKPLVQLASFAITGQKVNLRTSDFIGLGPRKKEGSRRAYEATKEDLEIIRARAENPDLSMDDIFVIERFVVNNSLSRSGFLKFTSAAIAKLARDFNAGRSRLMYHRENQVVGMTFFGEAIDEEIQGVSARFVRTREYMMRTSRTEDLITEIQGGIFPFDSIGVSLGNKIELMEEGDNRFLLVDYDPDDNVSPVEAHEVSFVHLGEIRGAGKRLSAEDSQDSNSNPETSNPDDAGARLFIFPVEDSGELGAIDLNKNEDEVIPMPQLKTVSHRLNATGEMISLELPEQFRSDDYFRKLEAEYDTIHSGYKSQISKMESDHQKQIEVISKEHAKLKTAVAGRIVFLEKMSMDDSSKYNEQKELDYYSGLSSDRLAAALEHAESQIQSNAKLSAGNNQSSFFSSSLPKGEAK